MTSYNFRALKQSWLALTAACTLALGCSGVGDDVDAVGEQQQSLSCAQRVSREDRVERGRWMTSTVDYEPVGGQATVRTTVSNSRSESGWTGGVLLVFVDGAGAALYLTDVRTRGVDACLFSCPRTSTFNWSDTVPADVRDRVAGVAIIHEHIHTRRLLFKAIKFLVASKPACMLAPPPWDAACKAVADAAKAADPVLRDMTQAEFENTVAQMRSEYARKTEMFPSCPGAGSSLVPAMTGPTTPSGAVFRSGAYGSTYEAWKAFDADVSSMWISETFVTPAVIGYEWPGGIQTVRRYALSFANGSLTSRAPRDWTLEGFNGASWVVVDRRSNETGWAGTDRREYTVQSPGAYSRYRLSFTDDNDTRSGVVVISLSGIEFFG
ncbi:hypothetical protein [Sorangium sp. So ce388]|uniref:hypothetical protein n=1 Tax=Sorangium sp. So ce388 TaxID=3133309 RepID=UPI003F5B480E